MLLPSYGAFRSPKTDARKASALHLVLATGASMPDHAQAHLSFPPLRLLVHLPRLHLPALRLLPTSLAITDGRRFRTPTRLSVTVRTTIVLPTADSCFAGCSKLNSDPTLGLCVPAPPAGVHSLTCSSSEANPPCKVRNNGPSKNELANSLPILALTGRRRRAPCRCSSRYQCRRLRFQHPRLCSFCRLAEPWLKAPGSSQEYA